MEKALRSDARRNRERLTTAAAAVFGERGLDAPLEEIAQRAGVSAGTLYNRFGSRDALVDTVMTERVARCAREIAAHAEAAGDPWEAFTRYVWGLCELQASDLGLNDAVSRRFGEAGQLTAICDAQLTTARTFVTRAQEAGVLRADFTTEDLPHILWSTSMLVRATTGVAPGAWRRGIALMLDGLRAPAAHPLPEPPMTPGQVREAMLRLGAHGTTGRGRPRS
ncbi:TetR/AcrR family transcriptional regulator [Actinoplanes sp. DH11]|uniref:TetR/AcrR family transcriptional regulator n=1 Tax=Actinoplanes sp. DH11 TaxID=2857011 RepID=UPI001E3935D3|nr:TetR/AcrR family transcriptional regulator [Actinoplanes sp. DH11]